MREVDETDLISFFGVLPREQSDEEREFFDAPLFVKTVGNLRISCSVSFQSRDIALTLAAVADEDDVLEYSLQDIETLRLEQDNKGSLWLRARSNRCDEVAVAVEPTIRIKIKTNGPAA